MNYTLELIRSNIKIASDIVEKNTPLTLRIVCRKETIKNSMVLVHLATRGLPTHYRLSENKDFKGAEWIPFECNYIDFELSKSKGQKEIYGQIKNNYYESEVSKEIIYLV